jgi:hypothetical protein
VDGAEKWVFGPATRAEKDNGAIAKRNRTKRRKGADGTGDYASRDEIFIQFHLRKSQVNTDVTAGLGVEGESERERGFRRNERQRREEPRPLGFAKVKTRAGWPERRRKRDADRASYVQENKW